MNDMMAALRVGQCVRVVDGGVPQYGQHGTVVARGPDTSWYVQLDGEEPDPLFFQADELELVAAGTGEAASTGVIIHRRPRA